MPVQRFSCEIENDPILGKVASLKYQDKDPKKNLTAQIAPGFGSNIFSFVVGEDNELFWCDKNQLVADIDKGAFTGNFVVAPIGVNREFGQQGVFEGQYLDFRDIPKPGGDPPLVHGFARLLRWNLGGIKVAEDSVSFDTFVRYGRDDKGKFYPYCEKAYPYDVIQTQRHVLTKKGLKVNTIFENIGSRNAPVAHTLHADFSTALSGPDKTLVSVPAQKHIEAENLLPIYPPQLIGVRGTDYDLNKPTPVSRLWLDDYYTGLDPSIPALYDPTTKSFKVGITASYDYQHFVIFTQQRDLYVALERQTNMPTALRAHSEGYTDLANLISLKPGQSKLIWTNYAIMHK